MINLDEYSDIGTHWFVLWIDNNSVTYFDSFGVEHIPKEIKAFINRPSSSASQIKNIKRNIFRIQAYDSVMCGYVCIGFIDFMLEGKTLTEFTDLFSLYDFKKNSNIILVISKKNEINNTNLTEKTKFQLSEIIGVENYFHQEINQRKCVCF